MSDEAIYGALVSRGAPRREAGEITEHSAGCPGIALELSKDKIAFQEYKNEMELARKCIDPSYPHRLTAARNFLPVGDDHIKARKLLFRRLELLEGLIRGEMMKGVELRTRRPTANIRRECRRFKENHIEQDETARADIQNHIIHHSFYTK